MIKTPYLILLGDETNARMAKMAVGLAHWRLNLCIGQVRFHSGAVSLNLPDMTISEAVAKGAKSMLVGSTPIGGDLPSGWRSILLEALENGLDIVSGLHVRLSDSVELKQVAEQHRRQIHDVRHSMKKIPIGNGRKRAGLRLLTVGTDCGVGKMYTALSLEKAMRESGMKVDFRATGQTGITIAGDGIAVDCVISDFVSGAAELLSPDNEPDHWDIIEGQGSLHHPVYAGVSLGLLHGSQPDAIVLCHEYGRGKIVGCESYSVPDIAEAIDLNLKLGALTNSSIRCVGISVNTSSLSVQAARQYLDEQQHRLGVPVVDPLRSDVTPIVTMLEKIDQ